MPRTAREKYDKQFILSLQHPNPKQSGFPRQGGSAAGLERKALSQGLDCRTLFPTSGKDLNLNHQPITASSRIYITGHGSPGSHGIEGTLENGESNFVSCHELARQIAQKYQADPNADPNAKLQVSLMSCYSGCSGENGEPSIAQRLCEELDKLGVPANVTGQMSAAQRYVGGEFHKFNRNEQGKYVHQGKGYKQMFSMGSNGVVEGKLFNIDIPPAPAKNTSDAKLTEFMNQQFSPGAGSKWLLNKHDYPNSIISPKFNSSKEAQQFIDLMMPNFSSNAMANGIRILESASEKGKVRVHISKVAIEEEIISQKNMTKPLSKSPQAIRPPSYTDPVKDLLSQMTPNATWDTAQYPNHAISGTFSDPNEAMYLCQKLKDGFPKQFHDEINVSISETEPGQFMVTIPKAHVQQTLNLQNPDVQPSVESTHQNAGEALEAAHVASQPSGGENPFDPMVQSYLTNLTRTQWHCPDKYPDRAVSDTLSKEKAEDFCQQLKSCFPPEKAQDIHVYESQDYPGNFRVAISKELTLSQVFRPVSAQQTAESSNEAQANAVELQSAQTTPKHTQSTKSAAQQNHAQAILTNDKPSAAQPNYLEKISQITPGELKNLYLKHKTEVNKSRGSFAYVFHVAKRAIKNELGIHSHREKQINQLATLIGEIKADPSLSDQDKAQMIYRGLDDMDQSIKQENKFSVSGLEGMCDEIKGNLRKEIPDASTPLTEQKETKFQELREKIRSTSSSKNKQKI